jgi:glucose-6-phosphate-specific signal transduction histidine kinase
MSRDLRKYSRQTTIRLMAGALILVFAVGDGLIYFFYGKAAALTGLLCLLGGMIPVIIIVLILTLLDWVRKRADHD